MQKTSEEMATGGRDDICCEQSRCLRVRFNKSRCEHCRAICPRQAISLDAGMAVDAERCSGCLLCTSVCPTGALELSTDFLACVSQLAKVPEPVLGCCRTKEQANGWLACLGGLSGEHLLYLSRRLNGTLTLNLAHCADCPNSSMLPLLLARLDRLVSGGSCSIKTVVTADAVHHRAESVDRRSFFKSFRTSLFQTAAVVMTAGSQETGRRSDYTSKRVPERRLLLLRVLEAVDQQKKKQLEERFFGGITFNEACKACQACAAICPTGALGKNRVQPDNPPLFTAADCTACGLCVEFCMDQAVTLHTPGLPPG